MFKETWMLQLECGLFFFFTLFCAGKISLLYEEEEALSHPNEKS